MEQEITRRELAALVAELAFAQPNDAVGLAMSKEPKVKGRDLRLVKELKKGRDGAVELKLIDREELIRLLIELTAPEETDAVSTLYGALDDAAKKLGEAHEV